jgi:type II secretory pathway pseudopilin PulG
VISVKPSRRSDGGFSLVEVVIALGILGGVLVSIAGLFVIGTRQVQSGRNASEALAVARTIVEEMQGWGFRQTYILFEDPLCTPGAASACTIDSKLNAQAARWQAQLESMLPDSRAEIVIESLEGVNLDVSSALRIHVTVFWTEGLRPRRVRLSAVRL